MCNHIKCYTKMCVNYQMHHSDVWSLISNSMTHRVLIHPWTEMFPDRSFHRLSGNHRTNCLWAIQYGPYAWKLINHCLQSCVGQTFHSKINSRFFQISESLFSARKKLLDNERNYFSAKLTAVDNLPLVNSSLGLRMIFIHDQKSPPGWFYLVVWRHGVSSIWLFAILTMVRLLERLPPP